jgi:hypothetical protein
LVLEIVLAQCKGSLDFVVVYVVERRSNTPMNFAKASYQKYQNSWMFGRSCRKFPMIEGN